MFVYAANPQFTHTLTVQVPTDGGHENQTFACTFCVLGDDELAKYDMNDRQQSSDFLRRAIVGFNDIVDAEKQPIPYSDKVRDWLIDLPYVRVPLVKGYFSAVYKAGLGN